jgi:phosphatidylserine/phosphatidylglycerophosphate/cardiolipin synthase-like enzyme
MDRVASSHSNFPLTMSIFVLSAGGRRRVFAAAVIVLLSLCPAFALSGPTSVEPLQDGSQVYPAIAQLVAGAHQYVHVAIWGFDDELRWDGNTQFPILHSRYSPLRNPALPRDTVEDLNCNQGPLARLPAGPLGAIGPLDPSSAIVLLRCKAAELAYTLELTPGLTAKQKDQQRAEVMVMVWHNHLDPDFDLPMTNLDDLEYILLDRSTLIGWTPVQLHDEMRRRGSGESMEVLLAFQSYYKSSAFGFAGQVPMPTGVSVMTQLNNNSLTASHHQKLVETELGAYIGGLNFLKEYWDTTGHILNSAVRFSSGSPFGHVLSTLYGVPGVEDYNGPLHDTGSIVQGDAVHDVNQVFRARWLSNLNHFAGVDATGEGQTPYGYIKAVLKADYPYASVPLVSYINGLESTPRVPSLAPALIPANPKFVVTVPPVLAVSRPKGSYSGAVLHQVRDEYNSTIRGLMPSTSSFAYFENQFAEDYDIFRELWKACNPKQPNDPALPPGPATWCRRDPYVYFVLPYEPAGIGIPIIDPAVIIRPTVRRETQNLLWLETKTATNVYDRNTGLLLMTLATQPPQCGVPPPYVHFTNPNVDVDPSFLHTTDTVEMLGSIPPITGPCPVQAHRTYALTDIITDGAFMSYVLATPGTLAAPPPPPANPLPSGPLSNYDAYLAGHAIYIHSKHTEFLGYSGKTPVTRLVIGSANINPRSLGVVTTNPPPIQRAPEAEDSETALFWTPANLSFSTAIWTDHLGFPATPPVNSPDWASQGWQNWKTIRGGGQPGQGHHVVRLDAILRCMRLNACP